MLNNKTKENNRPMRHLKVNDNIVETRQFRRYLEQYTKKHGYKSCPLAELPQEIQTTVVAGALISFTALDCSIEEAFTIEAGPLTLHCIKTGKYNVMIDAAGSLNIEKDDPVLLEVANSGHHIRLDADVVFQHPLAEVRPKDTENGIDQEYTNDYGFACYCIDAVRNPQDTTDGGAKADDLFRRMVLESGRPVHVEVLLHKVKAHYLYAMKEAATLISDGINKACEEQFKNR